MTEEQLIELAKEGDLDAYDDLMRTYYPIVERFSFQLGNSMDTVDDITQEVFLRVYRNLHQYSYGKFSTWLYKITLNVTKDAHRKRKSVRKKIKMLKRQPESPELSTEASILHNERDRELHRIIQQLDDKYKVPIVLFYFQEKGQEEIAVILKLPVNTVKTRISRGKSQLKSIWEGGDGK